MDTTVESNFNEPKRKCLTKSEYYEMVDWVDSSIKCNQDFILNQYGFLTSKALSKYSQ